MKIQTLAVHAANEPDEASGAIAAPIHMSTTYLRAADGSYPGGYVYGRSGNPNRAALESAMAQLEGGAAAAAFSSGLAAIHAIFQSLAAGEHAVVSTDIYHGTHSLLEKVMARWRLEISFVDFQDMTAVKAAAKANTRLIYLETPSNPLLKIIDLAQAAEAAHSLGARLVVDNTVPTPILQRPLEFGADLVVHSATKYLGGHSDVTGGVVITRAEDQTFAHIREVQGLGGAVPSPFDCWLLRRGLATLPLRVAAQAANAQQIAEFLQAHAAVSRVHYPGLPGHPGHQTARKQMSAFGGLLSFQVRAGEAAARKVAAGLKLFKQATSLGGVESLVEHRASIAGEAASTPRDLLRVSVGIEAAEDLIEDLDQALKAR
ncbi:MAG: aminotransferase class I/II-fold pyridoxal phosphate-dependent enzyme [Anaerolineales bacterium]